MHVDDGSRRASLLHQLVTQTLLPSLKNPSTFSNLIPAHSILRSLVLRDPIEEAVVGSVVFFFPDPLSLNSAVTSFPMILEKKAICLEYAAELSVLRNRSLSGLGTHQSLYAHTSALKFLFFFISLLVLTFPSPWV